VRLCPIGYYGDTNGSAGPNVCIACNSACASCAGSANGCTTCAGGYYMTSSICSNTCPNGTIASNYTGSGSCINCSISCVDLTINMYFSSILNE
jgi:hypothetical protein